MNIHFIKYEIFILNMNIYKYTHIDISEYVSLTIIKYYHQYKILCSFIESMKKLL